MRAHVPKGQPKGRRAEKAEAAQSPALPASRCATYSNICRLFNARYVCAAGNLDSTDWSESKGSTNLDELLPGAGPRPIDKYIYLRDLRAKNPTEYYRLLLEHGGDVSATGGRCGKGGARPAGGLRPHTLCPALPQSPAPAAQRRNPFGTDYPQSFQCVPFCLLYGARSVWHRRLAPHAPLRRATMLAPSTPPGPFPPSPLPPPRSSPSSTRPLWARLARSTTRCRSRHAACTSAWRTGGGGVCVKEWEAKGGWVGSGLGLGHGGAVAG